MGTGKRVREEGVEKETESNEGNGDVDKKREGEWMSLRTRKRLGLEATVVCERLEEVAAKEVSVEGKKKKKKGKGKIVSRGKEKAGMDEPGTSGFEEWIVKAEVMDEGETGEEEAMRWQHAVMSDEEWKEFVRETK